MRIFSFIGASDRAGSGLQEIWETWVRSFGTEPQLEETHSPSSVRVTLPLVIPARPATTAASSPEKLLRLLEETPGGPDVRRRSEAARGVGEGRPGQAQGAALSRREGHQVKGRPLPQISAGGLAPGRSRKSRSVREKLEGFAKNAKRSRKARRFREEREAFAKTATRSPSLPIGQNRCVYGSEGNRRARGNEPRVEGSDQGPRLRALVIGVADGGHPVERLHLGFPLATRGDSRVGREPEEGEDSIGCV